MHENYAVVYLEMVFECYHCCCCCYHHVALLCHEDREVVAKHRAAVAFEEVGCYLGVGCGKRRGNYVDLVLQNDTLAFELPRVRELNLELAKK